MTRPLFQRPSALPFRELGFRARASYAGGCIRRAALRVKYAKDSIFEKGLHSGETGAENSGVGFESGPDAEVDEIICRGDVSYFTEGGVLNSRTGKVS